MNIHVGKGQLNILTAYWVLSCYFIYLFIYLYNI